MRQIKNREFFEFPIFYLCFFIPIKLTSFALDDIAINKEANNSSSYNTANNVDTAAKGFGINLQFLPLAVEKLTC